MLRELERELESTARAQQAAASERAQQAAEQPVTINTLSLSPSLFLVSSDAFGANELGCELGLAHGATENGP